MWNKNALSIVGVGRLRLTSEVSGKSWIFLAGPAKRVDLKSFQHRRTQT